jgi:nitrogen fixation protein FixH
MTLFYSSGWINGLKLVGVNTGAGVIMIVVAFFLSACAVVNMIMLVKVGNTMEGNSLNYIHIASSKTNSFLSQTLTH